jgi:predicted ATP-grasp superfamily ATP-dependent carboligase
MEITFQTPKRLVIRPEESFSASTITISQMIDFPNQRKVMIVISEINHSITLWEGEEYDNIGQWTDQDVINKINELFQTI